jgi:type II secretion system protein G
MKRKSQNTVWGFTLIELLIVVAIIAILAAIAVPNFLEAQVRSKVSRVKSDLRTLATAMESYFVEWNKYPEDSDNVPVVGQRGFCFLTSPVAYITSLPRDPFNAPRPEASDTIAPYYEMGTGSTNVRDGSDSVDTQCYHISSVGPDADDDTDGNDAFPSVGGGVADLKPYDSTNGTRSNGDIYRLGGDYMAGRWTIFGIPHGQWGSVPPAFPQ